MTVHRAAIDLQSIRRQRHARTRELLARDLAAAEAQLAALQAESRPSPASIARMEERVYFRRVALERHDQRGEREGLV